MHNRPCQDRHPTPLPLECHTCLLYETDQKYRRLWGGGEVVAAAAVREHAERVRPGSRVTVVVTHTALDGTVTTTRTAGPKAPIRPANRFVGPPCPLLGEKIGGTPCGSPLHHCLADDTVCSTAAPCLDAIRTCFGCPLRPATP